MAAALRYWDSDCFLGWLAKEGDKVDDCRPVIKAAEAGEVRIVASALTLTEVVKMKSRMPITSDKEELIRRFFENDYIVIRQVTRYIAEYARQLIWRHGLDPKDSIHVATAVIARVPRMDTFDGKLINTSGQIGEPPLIIGRPDLPEQMDIFGGSGRSEDEDA